MTTAQIYKGAVAFIIIQLIMVVVVVAFPNLVLGGIDKGPAVDIDKIQLEGPERGYGDAPQDPNRGFAPVPDAPKADPPAKNDDMDAVLRAIQNEAKK